MALTDKDLQDILSGLTEEEQRALLEKLKGKFGNGGEDKPVPPDPPTPKTNSKVYCCTACGSENYKKHGITDM